MTSQVFCIGVDTDSKWCLELKVRFMAQQDTNKTQKAPEVISRLILGFPLQFYSNLLFESREVNSSHMFGPRGELDIDFETPAVVL